MLLLWQKRGLVSAVLAMASYTSSGCEFVSKWVQDQIKWATASKFRDIPRMTYFPSGHAKAVQDAHKGSRSFLGYPKNCLLWLILFDLGLVWIQIHTLNLCKRPLQAQQIRVLFFATVIAFIVLMTNLSILTREYNDICKYVSQWIPFWLQLLDLEK